MEAEKSPDKIKSKRQQLLVLLLVCVSIALVLVVPPMFEKQYVQQHSLEKLTPAQQWTMDMGALIIVNNKEAIDHLTCDFPPSIKDKIDKQKLLAGGWDIHNRYQLLDTLFWLERRGHREIWDKLLAAAKSGKKEDLEQCAREWNMDEHKLQWRLGLINKYGEQFGRKSILAWDYGRFVNVCRWGVTSGYMSEEDAWKWLGPVAKTTQKTFSSWSDYGLNYLIGRYFWSEAISDANNPDNITKKNLQWLTEDDGGYWKTTPWDTDLSSLQPGAPIKPPSADAVD